MIPCSKSKPDRTKTSITPKYKLPCIKKQEKAELKVRYRQRYNVDVEINQSSSHPTASNTEQKFNKNRAQRDRERETEKSYLRGEKVSAKGEAINGDSVDESGHHYRTQYKENSS